MITHANAPAFEFKPLPAQIRRKGYDYQLIERNGDVAIYSQSDETGIIAYEVFEVRKHNAWSAFGKDNEAKEAMPSDQEWGLNAFTVSSIERAREKAKEIQNNISSRPRV